MNIQGWRTFLAAGLTVLFGILASTDWISFLNDPKAGIMVILSGLLMAFMRTLTNTPPGQSVHPLETENASLLRLNKNLVRELIANDTKTVEPIISNDIPVKNEENSENSEKNV